MSIRELSKSYFSGFFEIFHFQDNSIGTNLLAIAKIASYLTVLLPAIMLVTYAASSCCLKGRVKENKNQDEVKQNQKISNVFEKNTSNSNMEPKKETHLEEKKITKIDSPHDEEDKFKQQKIKEDKNSENILKKDPLTEVKIESKPTAFKPYTLTYTLEMEGVSDEDRHKEIKVSDSNNESSWLIPNLSKLLNENHLRALVDGLPGLLCKEDLLKENKALEPYKKAFDIIHKKGSDFYLYPKIFKSEPQKDEIVRTEYTSGVVEEFKTIDNNRERHREGVRRFPNGTIEKGEFELEGINLVKGYRLENGEYTFSAPKGVTLFKDSEGKELCLSEIDIDGKKEFAVFNNLKGVKFVKNFPIIWNFCSLLIKIMCVAIG